MLSDDQIAVLAQTPTWIVHAENDPVVDITTTAIPTYERMLEAGAENLHFSKYENVIDPDYGNEVTLFQWLAAQSN